MKGFLQRWFVTTLAVLAATQLVSGIHCDTIGGLLIGSLLLGILNALVRPILLVLSLPLLFLTLGLFMLVINATLLYFVGQIVRSFHVSSFGAALWGSLVISLVSMVVNALIGYPPKPPLNNAPSQTKPNPAKDQGPIIDV